MVNRAEILWGSFVLLCLGLLFAYQGEAGQPAQAPKQWPDGLERGPNFTLVLVAHPRCPCTSATLRQLERIPADQREQLKTFVLFVKPPKTEADFHEASLWRQSLALTNVTTLCDQDGHWAGVFGCYTSGQALLYGPDGGLRFAGGLTPSRSHEGDSIGLEAIDQHLAQAPNATTSVEVYGCPLLSEGDPLCRP